MMSPSIDEYSQAAARSFSRRISVRLAVVFVLAYGYFLYTDIFKTTASSVAASRLVIAQSIKLGDRFSLDANLQSLTEHEFAAAFLYYRADSYDKSATPFMGADEINAQPNTFALVHGRLCFISDHPITAALNREFRLKLAKPLDIWMPSIWFSLLGIGIFSIGRFSSRTFRALASAYNSSVTFLVSTVTGFETIDQHPADKGKFRFLEVEHLFDVFRAQWKKIKANEVQIVKLAKESAVAHVAQAITHDMRAPLGTFERILLASDSELPRMRGAIGDSLNRLYAMIEALRHSETENIVRRAAGTIDFTFGIGTLEAKAQRLGIAISYPELPIPDAQLDWPQVERAWINLATNALDFAQKSVSIEAEAIDSDLIIRVVDDGSGVPDDFLPRLFKRGATHGKHDGTGLGLAYVRQIMRGHGGDVVYRRHEGLTIFECRLPDAILQKKGPEVGQTKALNHAAEPVTTAQKVAICLEPAGLSRGVVAALTLPKSDKFNFSENHEGADIVVSNIDDIMFAVLERDDQEFIQISPNWGDESGIIERLKMKFSL